MDADAAHHQLAELAEAYHRLQMERDPLAATYHGLDIGRDRLPDNTAAAAREHARAVAALATAVTAVPEGQLSPRDVTTRSMLLDFAERDSRNLDAAWAEFGVDAFSRGPQATLLFMLSRVDLDNDAADAAATRDFITRLREIPTFLRDSLERHRAGVARGRTPVQRGVAAAISQCEAIAEAPVESSLILSPLFREAVAPELRAEGTGVWRSTSAQAFTEYAAALADEIHPASRPDDRVGLCWLEDGTSLYRVALQEFTTLADPDPDAIHQTGLDIVEALRAEYAEIGGRFLGVTDLADISARLHDDPELNYASPSEIVDHAQVLCDEAERRVGEIIGRLPQTPCIVKAIPEVEAHGAAAAFYQLPAINRPYGTYWVNTVDPALPRAEAEATAFHEAAPGHHTQLALQLELDLPTFRRFGSLLSGYTEGWGLYAERLAVDLDLYSGDLGLLGMLAADSMRACRLVVDTGIHHLGWSRQQAIAYLATNSPLPPESVRAEIDRYIVYPGQACSYMLGRLEIQRLRAEAETALGPDFDLMAFHDVVLGEGAVPLTVLADNVSAWAALQA